MSNTQEAGGVIMDEEGQCDGSITLDGAALREFGRDLWYGMTRGLLDRLGVTEVGRTASRVKGQSFYGSAIQLRESDKFRPDRERFEDNLRRCIESPRPEFMPPRDPAEITFSYGPEAIGLGLQEKLLRRGENAVRARRERGKKPQNAARIMVEIMRSSDLFCHPDILRAAQRLEQWMEELPPAR